MFIQTETTPNPATIKFIPGQPVMRSGTREFRDSAAVSESPLAQRLFALKGVKAVFLGSDFISVTIQEEGDWRTLKPQVLAAVMDHFLSGLPAVNDARLDEDIVTYDKTNPVIGEIVELIETRVRPAVARDGGDITFVRFEDGVVYLKMKGACAGCPSSAMTLKSGIENMLKHYIPEVVRVEPVAV